MTPPAAEDPIRALVRASHHLPADRLGTAVADHARGLGAHGAVVYLADYAQHVLLPVCGEGVPGRQELGIDGSVAGRAFRRVEPVRSPPEGPGSVWLPLLDGAERIGVLELVVPGGLPPDFEDDSRAFASLVAELVVTRDAYSDVFSRLRRRRDLSLAAEIQWELLPPLTYASDHVVITGALEPTYDIGGDTFDYAVNGAEVDLLVLDAVGHGLPAALLATAAVGAYRHARRGGLDLPGIATAVDAVVAGQFPDSRFATAALARLDLDTGVLRWVNCGHPDPLLVRDGVPLRPPACPPARPLGLLAAEPVVCEVQLRPGDRLLLYTDGVVEARDGGGAFFGIDRLVDFLQRESSSGTPAPEVMRRLIHAVLQHQEDRLQDDATLVLVEWRRGQEDRLVPSGT